MDFRIVLVFLVLVIFTDASNLPHALTQGSALTVRDTLVSPNRLFTAGFYNVGDNAYAFAVWFTDPLSDGSLTAVWMANRDVPVNAKYSKLSLSRSGDLGLYDAGGLFVWATGTRVSSGSVELKLNDTGNLFLVDSGGEVVWQSFDSPTDTLLQNQDLTRFTELVASRSLTNYSSGFYKFYYDNDNVLRLLYDGPQVTSVYWPNPTMRAWDVGRSTYNAERIARFNSSGYFRSTDLLEFHSSDYGKGVVRRLTMDVDGNLRLYSLDPSRREWHVSWQAIAQPCMIHGVCGENSTCTYSHRSGRQCSCLPRHTMINPTDWSYGCKPEFERTSCGGNGDEFVYLPRNQFYGFDAEYLPNYTLDACKHKCLSHCDCKGIQYEFDVTNGYYICYVKSRMFTGFVLENYHSFMYSRQPKEKIPVPVRVSSLPCLPGHPTAIEVKRVYDTKQESGYVKLLFWFAIALGAIGLICVAVFFYVMRNPSPQEGYIQTAMGWRRFSYSELQKASGNFKDEIGRGGGGVVFKGKLPNNRIVAIKYLKEAGIKQGESEFLAEASTIGRVNHMNLLEIVGFCAERKHRLLVYEYMANGSLADNLIAGALDWDRRYKIAVGTARGLAYLHEECLDWVLHCDVKPQNILLDDGFNPKVADFGLSKLLERGGIDKSRFSTMRGTRGYMAPEWVFNLPITSKVDVYSYGVVVLEMITGKSSMGVHVDNDDGGVTETRLVSWVREKIDSGNRIEDIVDPTLKDKYNMCTMKNVAKVALQCVEEDANARPTMSHVVKMLLDN